MGDQPDHSLRARHSYYISQTPKNSGHSENACKSEVNVVHKEYRLPSNSIRKREYSTHSSFKSLGEYYKKYEHDEVPVKDSNDRDMSNIGGDKSLTNSELDKLEMKIFKNMSQELQTDDSSISSLESNIKFFRTTVQEIFDNFYASMRDFELYKQRFQVILAKNKEDAVADMEDFIKDMIQHIMSSETSISNDSRKSNDYATSLSFKDKESLSLKDKESVSLKDKESSSFKDKESLSLKEKESISFKEKESLSFKDKETNISNFDDESSFDTTTTSGADNLHAVIEAYKNDNYLTDSTQEENASKAIKRPSTKEEIFNIFLLSGNPCVQIKMNNRNLLSEINIKEPVENPAEGKHVASAENIERLAAKKMELQKYVEQQQDVNMPDREIPVKVSYAKKNIYLNEDFTHDRDNEKSFISKICNFLCRKFRKTS